MCIVIMERGGGRKEEVRTERGGRVEGGREKEREKEREGGRER